MALPASITKDGFVTAAQLRQGKLRRLMVGADGQANSGKTEFALSAPGPIVCICLDRGLDGVLDNPRPPATRCPDVAFKIIPRLLPTQAKQNAYLENWTMFRNEFYKALDNKDVRTVVLDTDSDSWELQRLAEFGQTQGVMPLRYAGPNAARKAFYAHAWDSGKIVIGTNRLDEEYETQLSDEKKEVRIKTGKMKRQGFHDWTYLWGLQIRHFRNEAGEYGIKILMCKADSSMEGMELTGEDCCFKSLVQIVYPQVKIQEWGF